MRVFFKLYGNSVLQARTLEILEFLLMSIRLQMLEKNFLDIITTDIKCDNAKLKNATYVYANC